jgi:hypothetical protein
MSNVRALPWVTPADLVPQPPAPARPGRVPLTDWQRMEVEEARAFLRTAPCAAELSEPRAAYLAGQLDATARILLDILDAITEVS